MQMNEQEIVQQLIDGLIFDPLKMKKYLGNLPKLYQYSILNQIRAKGSYYYNTKTDGEIFASYKSWQKVGRQVKKGEKSKAYMLRPINHKRLKEVKKDGEEVYEFWTTYRPMKVFDVTQTEGEPLQDNSDMMKGKSKYSYYDIKNKFNKKYNIGEFVGHQRRGWTNGEIIRVSNILSDNEMIATLVHELAHCECGHFEHMPKREIAELEAEVVSFIVTTMLGLENEKSVQYILNWNSEENARKEVSKKANVLINVADSIYKEIIS